MSCLHLSPRSTFHGSSKLTGGRLRAASERHDPVEGWSRPTPIRDGAAPLLGLGVVPVARALPCSTYQAESKQRRAKRECYLRWERCVDLSCNAPINERIWSVEARLCETGVLSCLVLSCIWVRDLPLPAQLLHLRWRGAVVQSRATCFSILSRVT